MEKTILVIGATGLLGQPVASQLKRSGFAVRLMVRNYERVADLLGDGFELLKGDINDRASIEQAVNGCFGVHINLSGEIEQIGVERVAAAAAKMRL